MITEKQARDRLEEAWGSLETAIRCAREIQDGVLAVGKKTTYPWKSIMLKSPVETLARASRLLVEQCDEVLDTSTVYQKTLTTHKEPSDATD